MNGYRHFLKRLLLFSIPIWLHVGCYVLADPFMVVYNYTNYYAERRIPVALDRDYVSTMTYVQNREKKNYDSFIFGNSRSMYYEIADWKEMIGKERTCYHFDASAESLYGMVKKVKFLDEMGDSLKHMLFVIDNSLLEQATPQTGNHLFYVSPILEKYRNVIGFHFTHWKTLLNVKFTYAVCDYYFSKEIKDYMIANNFFENYNIEYDLSSNEVKESEFEQAIAEGKYYTEQRMKVFDGAQTPGTADPAIGEQQLQMLHELKSVLDKHQSQFKIVISPLYNQINIHPADLAHLCDIFGQQHIFDYSGVNAITADYRNYYEAAHYRPAVAKKIMQEIYASKSM